MGRFLIILITINCLIIFLMALKAHADDVYKPDAYCHVLNKRGEEASGYPVFKKVLFYKYELAEQYAYLVNGLLIQDVDTKQYIVFHADGIEVPLLNMNCGYTEE